MDFPINIFWVIITIAIYGFGAFLLIGFFGLAFYLFYGFVWKNTIGKLACFKSDNEVSNVCFSCAFLVCVIWFIYDGSANNFVEKLANIFA